MELIVDPPDNAGLPAGIADLTLEAARRRPDDCNLRRSAARIEFQRGHYAAAAEGFDVALGGGCAEAEDFVNLCRSYHKLGRRDLALNACERGRAAFPGHAELAYWHGRTLIALGQRGRASDCFRRACALGMAEGPQQYLLQDLALVHDGAALLALADEFAAATGDNAMLRAARGVALSMLGRDTEANALVDLERHVVQRPLAALASDDEIAGLNGELSDIVARAVELTPDERLKIFSPPDLTGSAAMARLLALIAAAFRQFADHCWREGLGAALGLPLERGRLVPYLTILRDDGRNGQHLHGGAVFSGVYHLQLPPEIIAASDQRGALVLGETDEFAGGYQACWGTRAIAPKPGHLTLFPAHVFHDVRPTGSRNLRISIPVDLFAA